VESLHLATSPGPQQLELLASLHTFRYGDHAQFPRKPDDRPHDRRTLRVVHDQSDEFLRYLHPAGGISTQIVERGISRAEIVDGEPDAGSTETQQRIPVLA
jgi:hypothetical protein